MLLPTAHDAAQHRLQRVGWSLGIYSLAGPHGVVCVVEWFNGENAIRGQGETLEAAFLSACDQARGNRSRSLRAAATRRRNFS